MYSAETMRKYSGRQSFELPPHVYTIAESAYRALLRSARGGGEPSRYLTPPASHSPLPLCRGRSSSKGQCILITGES